MPMPKMLFPVLMTTSLLSMITLMLRRLAMTLLSFSSKKEKYISRRVVYTLESLATTPASWALEQHPIRSSCFMDAGKAPNPQQHKCSHVAAGHMA